MTGNYESRSRYLTLALGARRVIDILLPFIEKGEKTGSFKAALKGAASSLKSASSAEALLASLQTRQPTLSFEEIAIVDEVAGNKGRKQLVLQLERIVNSQGDLKTQKEAAREAVRTFFDIESRALHYFNQPVPGEVSALPGL